MEEEIDLRQYVEVLLKYKFWIIGLAVLAGVVAFGVGTLKPLSYQAEASLAILRVRSEVAFEPKFVTTSEEGPANNATLTSHLNTLAALAKSPAVKEAVAEELGIELNGAAKVATISEGNLILIQASGRDRQQVADVANAWAQQAEDLINSIYGQPSQQTLELQAQFQEVQAKYATAQRDLETFLAGNRIPELERQIKHRENLIASHQQTLTSNEAAVYNKAPETNRTILSDYYDELAATEGVLVDARALQEELARGGATEAAEWAQALALIGIQSRAFGTDGQQLQVTLGENPPATRVQDLEGLVTVLEEKAEYVRAAIEQQEQALFEVEVEAGDAALSLDSPLRQRIDSLTDELIELQAQLEAEEARERELSQARNLAWETYQTLARKLSETEVAVQVPGSEVRFAIPARPPEDPMPRGRVMNTAIAGMLGLMVGTFGAFAIEWWRQDEMPEASPNGNGDLTASAERS